MHTPPTPCPTCGHHLPIPALPQLCPVCIGNAAHACHAAGQRITLPPLPLVTPDRPRIRMVLTTALCGIPADAAQAILRRYDGPVRFCDAVCRSLFHEAAYSEEQDLTPKEGRCWWCRCALPDQPVVERYFLARRGASPHDHYGTSSTALVVGDLQVVGADADDLDEAMMRFANGMHLTNTRVFDDVAAAYQEALADMRRRGWQRPEPAHPVIYLALTNGVTVQAHAIDQNGPALEVLIQSANHAVPSWVVRTSQQHVREIDRLLRDLGVPSATAIGARLWVQLGLSTCHRKAHA